MKYSLYLVPILLLTVIPISTYASTQENLLPCDEVESEVLENTPDDAVELITAFTPAIAVDRVPPRYPESAARVGAEGWVQMSYVIDTTGRVKDPVIEDFAGHKSFKRSAIRAIKKWKFDPAMKDGKPTEQCHQSVQLTFSLGNNTAVSRAFVTEYKKAKALITAKNYEAANTLLKKMHDDKYRNMFENSWLWSIDAELSKALGDREREMASLKRVIASSFSNQSQLKKSENDYLTYVHQRLFTLQSDFSQFAEALETLEKLRALPNGEESLKPLEEVLAYVNNTISSDKHIFIDIKLKDEGEYFHKLARTDFAFANINGKVNTVEVRCESHRQKFTVAEDFTWSIPASWGQCNVMIKGDEQTTFELIEVGKV